MQTKLESSPSNAAPSSFAMPAFVDPKLQQICNQSVRNQLNNMLSQVSDSERLVALRTSVTDLVDQMLTEALTHEQLVDLFAVAYENLLTSYKQLELTESERVTSYINATGQVMSVDHAIHTFRDIYRVKAFIRGMHQAIESVSKEVDETLHIVYPACGPFAPLLLPLISHYSQQGIAQDRIKITLIDIQPGAVKTLKKVIEDLGVGAYIHEVLCCDVMDYQPDHKIDILLMEALQHGFSREGHFAFARHLRQFLSPNAMMIPEKITVTATMNAGQREYVDQWAEQERTHSSLLDDTIVQERIQLGEVFSLTIDTLRKLTIIPLGDSAELIECNQLQIPKGVSDINKKSLLLTVTAITFGEEQIQEYDSGISQPLYDPSVCVDFVPKVPEPDDLLVKSGDRLKFYYKLTGAPGFLPTRA